MSVVHFLCSKTCDVDVYHSSGGRPCGHPQNSLSVLKKKQKGKKEITTNAQTVNHFGNLCRCQNWRLHGPVHWWNSLFLILESLGKPQQPHLIAQNYLFIYLFNLCNICIHTHFIYKGFKNVFVFLTSPACISELCCIDIFPIKRDICFKFKISEIEGGPFLCLPALLEVSFCLSTKCIQNCDEKPVHTFQRTCSVFRLR